MADTRESVKYQDDAMSERLIYHDLVMQGCFILVIHLIYSLYKTRLVLDTTTMLTLLLIIDVSADTRSKDAPKLAGLKSVAAM